MFTNNKATQLKFDHTAKLVTLGIALLENTVNREIFAELNFHSLNPMWCIGQERYGYTENYYNYRGVHFSQKLLKFSSKLWKLAQQNLSCNLLLLLNTFSFCNKLNFEANKVGEDSSCGRLSCFLIFCPLTRS